MGLYKHPKRSWHSICPNYIWSYSENNIVAFISRISARNGDGNKFKIETFSKEYQIELKSWIFNDSLIDAMDLVFKELEVSK